MKQVSDGSTSPRAAGAGNINDLLFRVTIYENTVMHMGLSTPKTGESFFLILPYCNTDCMNVFLSELVKAYPDDQLLLVCDGAMWHKANALVISDRITLAFIPPYTPEMNPIEQIWKEIRKRGFRNEVFQTLEKVVDRMCDVIKNLPVSVIQSITGRQWIMSML